MTSEARRRRMSPDQRRQLLLTAAGDHISALGLDFSMDDVAREAGISPPLMRHYFGNRDGLLLALMEQGTDRLLAILTDTSHGDLAVRLSDYVEFVEGRPWAHHLWMAAGSSQADSLAPLITSTRRQLQEAAFASAWDEMDDDLRFRSSVWIAAVERSVAEWLSDRSMTRESLVARLVDAASRLGIPSASATGSAHRLDRQDCD